MFEGVRALGRLGGYGVRLVLAATTGACALVAGLPDWRAAPSSSDAQVVDGSLVKDVADSPLEMTDAAEEDAPSDGALDAGPPCDLAAHFSVPVALSALNTSQNESHARLTADELTIYFSTDRLVGGRSLVMRATRPSQAASWSAPVAVPELSFIANTDAFAPTALGDDLTMYATIWDNLVVPRSSATLMRATRATTFAPFGNALTPVGPLGNNNFEPYVLPSGAKLYLTKTPDLDLGPYVPYVASLPNGQGFGAYAPVVFSAGLPSGGLRSLVVSADDTVLYGSAQGNIYRTERATPLDPFGPLTTPAELNDPAVEDFPDWLSSDGCRLYLHRGSVANGQELFFAVRPPL